MGPEQRQALQQYAASKYGAYYAGLLASIGELSGSDANGEGGFTRLSERQWARAAQQLQADADSGVDLQLPTAGMTLENAGDYAQWRANPFVNLRMARALMKRNEASLLRRANQQRRASGEPAAETLLDAFAGDRSQLSFALAAAHRDGTGVPNPYSARRSGAGALIANGTFDLDALQEEYAGANDIVEYAALASDTAAEAVGDNKLQMTAPQIQRALRSSAGHPGRRHIAARAAQLVPETELTDDPAVVDELLAAVPADAVSGANGAQMTTPVEVDEQDVQRARPEQTAFDAGRGIRDSVGGFVDRFVSGANRDNSGLDGRNRDNSGVARVINSIPEAIGNTVEGAQARAAAAADIVANTGLGQFAQGLLTGEAAPVQTEPTRFLHMRPDVLPEVAPAAVPAEPVVVEAAESADENPLQRAAPVERAQTATQQPSTSAGSGTVSAPQTATDDREAIRAANQREFEQALQYEHDQLADLAQQTAAIQAQQDINQLAFQLAPQMQFSAADSDPRRLATSTDDFSPGAVLDDLVTNQTSAGNLGVLTRPQVLDVANLAGATPQQYQQSGLNVVLGASDPIQALRNTVPFALYDQRTQELGVQQEQTQRAAQAQVDRDAAAAANARIAKMIRDALRPRTQ